MKEQSARRLDSSFLSQSISKVAILIYSNSDNTTPLSLSLSLYIYIYRYIYIYIPAPRQCLSEENVSHQVICLLMNKNILLTFKLVLFNIFLTIIISSLSMKNFYIPLCKRQRQIYLYIYISISICIYISIFIGTVSHLFVRPLPPLPQFQKDCSIFLKNMHVNVNATGADTYIPAAP